MADHAQKEKKFLGKRIEKGMGEKEPVGEIN